MFNEKQSEILASELDTSRIKTRQKANVSLSYLEGFDVIESANAIFGFGNWSYSIVALEQVSQEINNNQNLVICYKAIVKVEVFSLDHANFVVRQDVGFGTGVARSPADAHENAAKEAVTDALKRSLRTFGNQFGNSLYDKSRQNQTQQNQTQPTQTQNARTQIKRQTNDQIALRNLGLQAIEKDGFLLLNGKDVFAKRDEIKLLGFRWDNSTKQWYKAIANAA
ncbi:Rad52/Rad22 family DNA repair protein [Campylobacter mucosalis]|uniref:Rad52/Rad22 family DNA repair protein n=1 Tax=Campylobacter mucosalis TaxID=202 RepID=UPI00146FEB20|nr:Rad52/Rad22 family DNA repair protein [Campylobacter mucosalis]